MADGVLFDRLEAACRGAAAIDMYFWAGSMADKTIREMNKAGMRALAAHADEHAVPTAPSAAPPRPAVALGRASSLSAPLPATIARPPRPSGGTTQPSSPVRGTASRWGLPEMLSPQRPRYGVAVTGSSRATAAALGELSAAQEKAEPRT